MAESTNGPELPYLYDAFISYRHVDRDRKWAEWLIEALESYRLPKALQDRGFPPRLRKIFRDVDEAPASSDLNDAIKQALVDSRFLIVVCSPYTPRSKWVEREIQMFNELGRADQVLALLTEGEPNDSFPTPLLERLREITDADGTKQIVKENKEPLAADVRPSKVMSARQLKRFALLRLVAVILGVKFDDLRQREQERDRKKKFIWASLAAAMILLAGASSGVYWQMTRLRTAYFREAVMRWGVPEGLGHVDEQTRGRLATSYRFVTQRGRVVEVRRESSGGALRPHDDGETRWVIRYGFKGLAEVIEVFNGYDALIREDHLQRGSSANTMVVNFKRDTVDVAQAFKLFIDPTTSSEQGMDVKSDITRHQLTFDDRGFVIERRYQNHYGAAQHNLYGSYGQNFTNSAQGLVLRYAEIGSDGNEAYPKGWRSSGDVDVRPTP